MLSTVRGVGGGVGGGGGGGGEKVYARQHLELSLCDGLHFLSRKPTGNICIIIF